MVSTIILIVIFACMVVFIVVATELRERRRSKQRETDVNTKTAQAATVSPEAECCGRHAICEKNSLLSSKPEITYYDDEELDALSGRDTATYTNEEEEQVRDVFSTLKEEDIAGWLRSLQLRGIELPDDIKEEALMIVSDRRFAATAQ